MQLQDVTLELEIFTLNQNNYMQTRANIPKVMAVKAVERNKVKLHPLDPIFVTKFNPDPSTNVLVCFERFYDRIILKLF